MARDHVQIEQLRVDCVVGVYAPERVREQPLLVDLELGLDTAWAGYSGRISGTVDYDRVCDELAALLRFRRYRLLEMAAEEICAMLTGLYPRIETVRLGLRKPRALPGRARSAGVRVQRNAGDYPRAHESTDFGEVEILYESSQAGLYLLHIEPGRGIPPHYHQIMRELEWHVTGEIERDGVRLRGFEPVEWAKQRVHRYQNVGDERATLFCCDSPSFVRADEVVVARDPGERAQ